MNKSDYIIKAKKHLNSVDTDGKRIYEELSFDCTKKFIHDIGDILLAVSPKTGNIYFPPKIHKKVQSPLRGPISNTIDTPAMNLSKWVDMQLPPLFKKQPSYPKDDNDFFRKIDELNRTQTIHPNAILVT